MTCHLSLDQRIIGAINGLVHRITIPNNLPPYFPVDYFGINALYASFDVFHSPPDSEELFSIYEFIETVSTRRISDTRIIIEHFPFSFTKIYPKLLRGGLNLSQDYKDIFIIGGDK